MQRRRRCEGYRRAAAGPGRALRRRAQPPISHHAPLLWRAPEGPEGTGGLRDRPLRAKLACGDLAGGRTRRHPEHQRHHKHPATTQRKHAAAPPERRTRPGCWWAASGPGRALRRRAQPPISHHAPLLWRAPEGPEGTGGLRDRPLRAAGSRVAISRAAGPDGARNTSGTTSNHATQTRGSPSGPPRVHATSSYSTPSRGRAFSAVAGPRPQRPGPR